MRRSWVVVLAGGEGSRLASVTRNPLGEVVPKQFCCFSDHRSLLERTLDRARALTHEDHVLVVVMEHHRHWWRRAAEVLPAENVICQRRNHGTAAAVHRALGEVLRREPDASLVVLPSDHEVENGHALTFAVRRALVEAERWRDEVVLIGMEPEGADPGYGWILPAGRGGKSDEVSSFVEKPDPSEAARILRRGGLVNSFIVAARAQALSDLYRLYLPELEALTAEVPSVLDAPARDFGRHLLQRAAGRLRVVRAPLCGWTDLGTPERLRRWLSRHEERLICGAPAATTS